MPKVLNISQDVVNPITGEMLITEEKIVETLEKYTSIKEWAYVLHDKDVFTEDAIEKSLERTKERYGRLSPQEKEKISEDEYLDIYHNWKKMGEPKPSHYHIVLRSDRNMEIKKVAQWFGIPANMIDAPTGRSNFVECVRYLTHESDKCKDQGKVPYDDDEIKSNFDWRKMIDEYDAKKAKYGSRSERDYYRHEVLYEGMPTRQVIAENPDAYQNDYAALDKMRMKYICERAEVPSTRVNFYLSGKGGVGKDLTSRALARALYPDLKNDDDIFFVVGAGQVAFDGYDGQPVLIWSDRRAAGLMRVLGGRENFFNVFDTHPTRQRQNIKYGALNLCNVVNIVNGQESYSEFLDGIAGEYTDRDGKFHEAEDKGQSYRRFPFIMPLHDDDFDLLVNKGYILNDRNLFQEFYEYNKIRGSIAKVIAMCGGENELARDISQRVLAPITDKYNEAVKPQEEKQMTKEEILALVEKEGWGKQKGEKELVDTGGFVPADESNPFKQSNLFEGGLMPTDNLELVPFI